jgi:transcriptional regulator NrdR family protein
MTACTTDKARSEKVAKGLASLICEGDILEDPRITREHIDELKHYSGSREDILIKDREVMLPDINTALYGRGITEKDVEAFASSLMTDSSRHKAIEIIATSVNEQCLEIYLKKNSEIQYAMAAIIIWYTDPEYYR